MAKRQTSAGARASLPLSLSLAMLLGHGLHGCVEPSPVESVDEQVSDTPAPDSGSSSSPRMRLEPIGVYAAGDVGAGAAEIVAFDGASARLFATDPSGTVAVLDLRDPRSPRLIGELDLSAYGHATTSVDVAGGIVAVAVSANRVQDLGVVVFFDAVDLSYVNHVHVGALPDMLSFSPDEATLVIACEGEPSDDYEVDPPGVVAIVDVSEGVAELSDDDVRVVGFEAFGPERLDAGVRVLEGSSAAQDLEPEFVAFSADSRTAWVSLQENNALAILDLETASVTEVVALGSVRHPRLASLPQHSSAPVFGMRQPDAVASVVVDGREFVVSANEGECRRYEGLDEFALVRDLRLDPVAFPDAAALQRDDALGRVVVSSQMGDLDRDGDYDELYGCGSRSISVLDAAGALVWDSGALLERLSPASLGGDEPDEGAGPEGVVTAQLWGRPYAFVGLERAGGIVVLDLSTPAEPSFVLYEEASGDLGPEGLDFVAAEDSPIGEPLLIVANEISETVRIYRIVGDDPGR